MQGQRTTTTTRNKQTRTCKIEAKTIVIWHGNLDVSCDWNTSLGPPERNIAFNVVQSEVTGELNNSISSFMPWMMIVFDCAIAFVIIGLWSVYATNTLPSECTVDGLLVLHVTPTLLCRRTATNPWEFSLYTQMHAHNRPQFTFKHGMHGYTKHTDTHYARLSLAVCYTML